MSIFIENLPHARQWDNKCWFQIAHSCPGSWDPTFRASSKLIIMFYVYDRSTDLFNSSDINPRYIATNQEEILVLSVLTQAEVFRLCMI